MGEPALKVSCSAYACKDAPKGFKERAVVSGDRTIGTASCTQQHTQVSCATLPTLP